MIRMELRVTSDIFGPGLITRMIEMTTKGTPILNTPTSFTKSYKGKSIDETVLVNFIFDPCRII